MGFVMTKDPRLHHLLEPLDVEARRSSVKALATALAGLDAHNRGEIIEQLALMFSESSSLADEDLRVVAVKVAIALLPQTAPLITDALERRERLNDFELHFSLFCFLDEVPSAHGASIPSFSVPRLIAEYLDSINTDAAQAASMAADLLADHWDVQEGTAVLLRILADGRSEAGRVAAVQGLATAASRGASGDLRESILLALHRAARDNRSQTVREWAALELRRVGEAG